MVIQYQANMFKFYALIKGGGRKLESFSAYKGNKLNFPSNRSMFIPPACTLNNFLIRVIPNVHQSDDNGILSYSKKEGYLHFKQIFPNIVNLDCEHIFPPFSCIYIIYREICIIRVNDVQYIYGLVSFRLWSPTQLQQNNMNRTSNTQIQPASKQPTHVIKE